MESARSANFTIAVDEDEEEEDDSSRGRIIDCPCPCPCCCCCCCCINAIASGRYGDPTRMAASRCFDEGIACVNEGRCTPFESRSFDDTSDLPPPPAAAAAAADDDDDEAAGTMDRVISSARDAANLAPGITIPRDKKCSSSSFNGGDISRGSTGRDDEEDDDEGRSSSEFIKPESLSVGKNTD